MNNKFRHLLLFGLIFSFIFWQAQVGFCQPEGWEEKEFFKIDYINGRPIFISPDKKPFYAISMVYAYGPETGPHRGNMSAEKVIKELKEMKKQGFNTLDLYGDFFLKDILDWCDKNEMALYFRTSYTNLPDFPKELSEFPDFMDENFRQKAKHYYDKFLAAIKDYHCVLAIDMDQRWLFDLDWSGERRRDIPKLGPAGVAYLPEWLENKYKQINKLNLLWHKRYRSFRDILNDKEIIKDNIVQPLGRKPWRVDFVEYANWTINDFLLDLTSYMKLIDPNHMITYTSELPEVVPFPISTKDNSGIDFISPVHYNSLADFDRDWVGNAEMLYMTKFHYDLQKLPVYINETGFRTSPLASTPPNMAYAAARPGDERHMAELYLRQTALMDTYPWLLGWAYFKWYDKLYEGDFGYIRDDGTQKPISKLGQFINSELPVNMYAEDEPQLWIYYPYYALASDETGYSQLKTLVLLLERDFLDAFEKMIEEVEPYISKPSQKMLDKKIFIELPDIFKNKWRPFAFTSVIPGDDEPVILAGGNLKQLSRPDRRILKTKKTITFGSIGLRDERYNITTPYFAELVGIDIEKIKVKFLPVNIKSYLNNDGLSSRRDYKKADFDGEGNSISKRGLPPISRIFKVGKERLKLQLTEVKSNDNIACNGQVIDVEPSSYTAAYFLMASAKGDAAAKVKLQYVDGSSEELYFAPAISDWRTPPFFTEAQFSPTAINTPYKMTKEPAYIALIKVPVSGTKILKAIKLPDIPRVHIFAVTLEEGGPVKNCLCEVDMEGIKVSGRAGWLMLVEDGHYKTLATFSNGFPAIVQSKDGRHIAFLFDALSWRGQKDEISKDTQNLSLILDKVLLKLKEGN